MTASISIHPMGEDALTIRFAEKLSDGANRAALAFAAALRGTAIPGVAEIASGLVSVLVRLDGPARLEPVREELQQKLAEQDWFGADLPSGRRRISVPTRFDSAYSEGVAKMADKSGQSEAEVIAMLYDTPLRVLALGFKPGQPYLGFLPDTYHLSRGTELARVETGDIATALGQLVLFAAPTPTGWQKIGESALWPLQLQRDPAILLSPGDELRFEETGQAALDEARARAREGRLSLREEKLT